MDDYDEFLREKEYKKFSETIGAEQDPVMLVLRAHLNSENLLERLINVKLPRGDKIIENGSLSYHQKLVLVEALDCLGDAVISSLRNLNKLRNQCAHELNKQITEGDITKVGSPLGKTFTKYKYQAKHDEAALLRSVIHYVSGYVTGVCVSAEAQDAREQKPNNKQIPNDKKQSEVAKQTEPEAKEISQLETQNAPTAHVPDKGAHSPGKSEGKRRRRVNPEGEDTKKESLTNRSISNSDAAN